VTRKAITLEIFGLSSIIFRLKERKDSIVFYFLKYVL